MSGYLITFYAFLNTPEARTLPLITRTKGEPDLGLGLGHTAIIVLAHGEPETYAPSAWIKQMKEFDEQKITFIPYPFRPFFFYSLREKYLMAGKSGHNFECLQIMKQIEAEYKNKGDQKTKFYISYLENEPYLDTAVIKALNEGASNIIICNIFVTISSHTQEAIDMITPLNLKDYSVSIHYSKPLYDSKSLQQLYVDTLNHSTKNSDKKNVGVILIGHGQPLEWDEEFYTQTQQETSFRKDILKQLELDGYISKNLKLAWMEFRDPRPKDAVKHLVEEGATEIFYFSTIIGSESIHAKYDVPQLIHEIKVPNTVKLQQLTAFDDKSGIVKALIERIEDCK
jgi:protoheme ferro-lyase